MMPEDGNYLTVFPQEPHSGKQPKLLSLSLSSIISTNHWLDPGIDSHSHDKETSVSFYATNFSFEPHPFGKQHASRSQRLVRSASHEFIGHWVDDPPEGPCDELSATRPLGATNPRTLTTMVSETSDYASVESSPEISGLTSLVYPSCLPSPHSSLCTEADFNPIERPSSGENVPLLSALSVNPENGRESHLLPPFDANGIAFEPIAHNMDQQHDSSQKNHPHKRYKDMPLTVQEDFEFRDKGLSLDSASRYQFGFSFPEDIEDNGIGASPQDSPSQQPSAHWPSNLVSTHSCPSLTNPAVVISDYSHDNSKQAFDGEEHGGQGTLNTPGQEHQENNAFLLAIHGLLNCDHLTSDRRYSSCSSWSSSSSLSTVGYDDDNDRWSCEETKSPPNKPSPWRKVRNIVHWSPFVQTYKKQKYPWVQLGGHQGNFKSGNQGTILKKLCGEEEVCFNRITGDVLQPFTPAFTRKVVVNDEEFLEMEDLLAKFESAFVMDVKMGIRTYLEDELAKAREKPKLRKDMFEKMVQIDPKEPTDEENRLKAITKPRYMIWRETISSTATLGFRIEGVKYGDGATSKEFKLTKSEDHVYAAFNNFVGNNHQAITKYLERLKDFRSALLSSPFFKSHELIGSSLLFVHDLKDANVWMIDFAKTYQLPEDVTISHNDEWKVGNHEDGYLIGVDSLIRIFERISGDQ